MIYVRKTINETKAKEISNCISRNKIEVEKWPIYYLAHTSLCKNTFNLLLSTSKQYEESDLMSMINYGLMSSIEKKYLDPVYLRINHGLNPTDNLGLWYKSCEAIQNPLRIKKFIMRWKNFRQKSTIMEMLKVAIK